MYTYIIWFDYVYRYDVHRKEEFRLYFQYYTTFLMCRQLPLGQFSFRILQKKDIHNLVVFTHIAPYTGVLENINGDFWHKYVIEMKK